jgi:hypothetical protein
MPSYTTEFNTKAADHANALSPGHPQAQCSTLITLVTYPHHDINFPGKRFRSDGGRGFRTSENSKTNVSTLEPIEVRVSH